MNNLSQDYNTTLEILKKEGTQTLKELALALTITTEGARFQLQKLSEQQADAQCAVDRMCHQTNKSFFS